MKQVVFAIATMFVVAAAHAQTVPVEAAPAAQTGARFLLGAGLSFGGDKLATVEYENGDDTSLHAGGLIYLTAGVDYRFSPEFSLQGTVNYHVDRANAKNGNVTFERFPIELIGYYHVNPSWRVGAGVRYVSSPKLNGKGFADGMDADFDSTTSPVIEAEYFATPKLGVKVLYVNEKLKPRGYEQLDASHVGVSANFYF